MAQKLSFPGRDAQSINDIPVNQIPAPTDGQALVYDAATGKIFWGAAGLPNDLAGRVTAVSFGIIGGQYVYDVVFGTPLPPGTTYQVLLGGNERRVWSSTNLTVNGFRIQTNSLIALTVGTFVYWRIVKV